MEYPNISFLKKFDAITIAGALDILAKDTLWHFFNPGFTDIQGDHVDLKGPQAFLKITSFKLMKCRFW